MTKRTALRYHGGKFKMSDWIIEKMPPHQIYVEPFGGGAGVLLTKPQVFLDVYNDLNSEVVNFFQVLRDQPDNLLNKIMLTPYSREEFILAKYATGGDEIERARRFFTISWQSRGAAGMQQKGGWRHLTKFGTRHKTPVDDWNNLEHLLGIAFRLKKVQIEHIPALDIFRKYDGETTLFYCDPPYMVETRGNRGTLHTYSHEMSDEDHRELIFKLRQLRGNVMISGYESPLYLKLLHDWELHKVCVSKDNHSGFATECLWIKPYQKKSKQLDIFTKHNHF